MDKKTNIIHFIRPSEKSISTCGIKDVKNASYDARDCNCTDCMKTRPYKIYMGIEN